MTEDTSLQDFIEVIEYNPDWPEKAEAEITWLYNLFATHDWITDIQHIGSTAVPGLAAKPIIDIYVGVKAIEDAQQAIGPLEQSGYQFWKDNPNKEKMFFVKGMPPFGTGRTHHIHIVKHDSRYWRAQILFRDYMRTHPEEIPKYAKLKYKLMQKYRYDREAYTDAKTDLITRILRKAGFTEEVRR